VLLSLSLLRIAGLAQNENGALDALILAPLANVSEGGSNLLKAKEVM
jgi:hypothetical protein